MGDLQYLRVGQQGFCGARDFIPPDQYMKLLVRGNQRVWLDVGHRAGFLECKGDYSFVPDSAAIYVIKFTAAGTSCLTQLFQVVEVRGSNTLLARQLEKSQREIC